MFRWGGVCLFLSWATLACWVVERVESAGNEGFKEVKFIGILSERLGVLTDGFGGLLDMLVVKGLSEDGVFDGFGAPRGWSGRTEDDAQAFATPLFDLGGYSDLCEGPVCTFFVFLLEVKIAAVRRSRWDVDLREDILWAEDRFTKKVSLGRRKKVLDREGLGLGGERLGFDQALVGSRRFEQRDGGTKGDQGASDARRMDHCAEGVVVDSVVDVFAFLGKAAASAFFEALEVLAAKVPTAGSLAKVSAEGGEVADLCCGDGLGGLDKGRGVLLDQRVVCGLGESEHGADG